MICFIEDNFLYSNIPLRNRTEKKDFLTHFVRDCRLRNNLLSSSTLYMFGLSIGLSPARDPNYLLHVRYNVA